MKFACIFGVVALSLIEVNSQLNPFVSGQGLFAYPGSYSTYSPQPLPQATVYTSSYPIISAPVTPKVRPVNVRTFSLGLGESPVYGSGYPLIPGQVPPKSAPGSVYPPVYSNSYNAVPVGQIGSKGLDQNSVYNTKYPLISGPTLPKTNPGQNANNNYGYADYMYASGGSDSRNIDYYPTGIAPNDLGIFQRIYQYISNLFGTIFGYATFFLG